MVTPWTLDIGLLLAIYQELRASQGDIAGQAELKTERAELKAKMEPGQSKQDRIVAELKAIKADLVASQAKLEGKFRK